jgi:Ca2+-transporting ATPase
MGNPTEAALLLWLDQQGLDYLSRRHSFQRDYQLPFSTERKLMATLGISDILPSRILHVKGAPELLLAHCTHVHGPAGLAPLATYLSEITDTLTNCQQRARRTLGFAYRRCPEDVSDIHGLLCDLVWLGFVAIADPIRQEVPPAVEACRRAGIHVKIVTGDNADTAREVGRQIGLLDASTSSDALLTGPAFSALSDAEARRVAPGLRVLARARPADKMRLVRLLQDGGEIVAVTGDGTNDAPALHQANVGLAMGKIGTSAAREASDIVLLDDSFQSIVNAVVWGRSLYLNIQRFILFQLTINVAALVLALLGPFIGIELPFTVIQMLWINLIMDTFAALALATEPADPGVLNHPPRNNAASIISSTMAWSIFLTAAVFVAVLLSFLLIVQGGKGPTVHELTVFFALFVMLQFWNLFNARRLASTASALAGLATNPFFLLIAAVILGGTISLVQFGGTIFRTVPLTLNTWLTIIASTSLVLLGGELVRFVQRATARRPAGA